MRERGASLPASGSAPSAGGVVHVAINGAYRGRYVLSNPLRTDMRELIRALGGHYDLALLSGDNERDREQFIELFGPGAQLKFNQQPLDKLNFIRALQESGRTVMMVGDGLNDAGALQQSDVGVAVVERVGLFSPASDAILGADQISRLDQVLVFARQAHRIVQVSSGISGIYNVVGVSIAAAGLLSPLVCAILMPLSSVSVVLFACGVTSWAARRSGFNAATLEEPPSFARQLRYQPA
jgi:Cu+-exporting ATPase